MRANKIELHAAPTFERPARDLHRGLSAKSVKAGALHLYLRFATRPSILSQVSLIPIGLFAFLFLLAGASAYSNPSQVSQAANGVYRLRAATQGQQKSDIRDLEPGRPIERELAVNKSHAYRATLKAGEYIKAVVEHKGIDVSIALFGTDGKKIVEVESASANEKEFVSLVGEASGAYVLEVRRQDSEATTGRYEIRIEEWRSATQRDRDRFAAQGALWEGDELKRQGTAESLRKAIEKYRQALPLWRAVEDLGGEANSLNHLASAYSNLGDTQKALQYYNEALPLFRAARDLRSEAITLNNIGIVYSSMGESEKALDYYGKALILKQSIGDRKSEANTVYSIASAYMQLGELQKALEYYDRALPLTRVTGERLGEALTLSSIGTVYYKMGNWQKSSECNSQALVIIRALGERRFEALMLHNIATVYSQLGDLQTAMEYYNQALPLRRTVGDKRGEAYTLDSMGTDFLALGQNQKALDHFSQALSLMRDVRDKYGEAYVLSNLGAAYARSGKFENAKDYFDQALRVSQATGDRLGEALTLRNLGSAYVNLNEFEKAMEYLSPALKISRAVGDRNREAVILSDIARVERGKKRLSEAIAQIEASLAIVESTRQAITSQGLRASYMTTKRSLYEFYIDVLMQMHKESPAGGFDLLALQASERARARNLLDMLTESRADIRQGVDAELLDKERALQQQLGAKSERLTRLLTGKHTEEQETTARKQVEALLVEYSEVEAQIRAKSPRYAALTQPEPLSIKEIQKEVLDDDTLLLEYALGKERSYLWAVTTTSIKSFELPGQAEIESAAQRVYELLVAKADGLYPEALTNLSEMVLKPAVEQLGRRRLLIVSEGALQYIPFGALPDPRRRIARSASEPLIQNHEIVNLPSVSTLAVLRRELSQRKSARKSLAVLADPVFEKNDERVRPTIQTQQSEEQYRKVKEVDKTALPSDVERSTRELGLNSFDRLVLSRREAEVITALASGGQPLKALDFAASRATATSSELGEYQIVHFATHSLLNNQHPELSGIVLSLVDEQGRLQDGFLRLYEIYNLKLGADLLVLSSCRTALGKEIKGEGLVGLTRGFMYAGVPRVVASLWKVSDKATSELMKRFYQKMLRDGMRPAAALRAAQVSMMNEKPWRPAYYWAGFVLQGEWK
jgi:CHAT domain-containing protein/Tfp pilus assembly protein PilF